MKLYISVGPNPRVVRMFAAEKGISFPEQWVDLVAGENRKPPFMSINPAGQLPVLETSTGQVIAETMAICEFLEETSAGPKLLGESAEERARVRMWARRVDLAFCEPVTAAFRYGPGLDVFKDRVHCIPHAAADMAEIVRENAAWIDAQLGDRAYLAGDRFSLADIVLYCFADFAARRAALPFDPALARLACWFARVNERPSAQQTAAVAYGARPD